MSVSRRRLLLGFLGLSTRRAFAAPLEVARYRASVTIAMLGASVFTRQNVGGAFLRLQEVDQGSRRMVRLHFAGASNAARAQGIVYAGSMEETVIEDGDCGRAPMAASYFGFITAPEDRRESLRTVDFGQSNANSFVAVEGSHELGVARRKRVCVVLPERSWRDLPDLIGQVRSHFAASDLAATDLPFPGKVPATFLHSIVTAIRSERIRSTQAYVHNGRVYRLESEKVDEAGGGTRFTGHIFADGPKRISSFRIWLDANSDLPLRIEFQARSYLRITLEKEEA